MTTPIDPRALMALAFGQPGDMLNLMNMPELREQVREEVLATRPNCGPRSCALEGGRRGYYMRRSDDCFAAAAATVLECPIEDVPDAEIDRRIAAGGDPATVTRDFAAMWDNWLDERGLQALIFTDPLPLRAPIWLGIVPWRGGLGESHCLAMSYDEVLHDPVSAAVSLANEFLEDARRLGVPGASVRVNDKPFGLDDVKIGVLFEPVLTQPKE